MYCLKNMRIETGFLERRDCGGTGENPEDKLINKKRQTTGKRNSEHPGPYHVAGDTPFDCAEAFCGTDSHNGGGNDVGCGERDAQTAGNLNDHGCRALGCKAVNGGHADQLGAHGFNNSSAAGGSTGCQGDGADPGDPVGDIEIS